MNRIFLASLAIAFFGIAAQAQQQDWIEDTLSKQCSAESRAVVAAAVRAGIEENVARAEASIRAPAAIGDLSCLEALIAAPLDVFSRAHNIIDNLVSGLQSGLSANILDGAVARAICAFAQEKFGSQTRALAGSMNDIVSRNTVTLPKFSDRFGVVNVGFNRNTSSGANSTEVTIIPQVQHAPPQPQTTTERQRQIQDLWDNLNPIGESTE